MSDETRVGDGDAGAREEAPRLRVNSEFAGHRIEAELGRGGMGVVYRARHLALDAPRALKVIAPALSVDPTFRRRFQRESRLAASIDHPNVITIHHAGEEGELLYISMRLVDGGDLRGLIEAEGPLGPTRAINVIAAVAAGLDAAHRTGLVHRDVKPANVLLERATAGNERVFLTDFGISRISGGGSTLTTAGQLLGSVDYMAPEQIEGNQADRRADVYSLGCVAYFALTGRPPFPLDGDMARLYAHANAPRPRPSDARRGLPESVDRVVGKAMAISPDDRYDTAGELAAALAEADPAEMKTRVTQVRAPRRRVSGRLALAALAALAAMLAAAAAAVLALSGGGSDLTPPPSPGTAIATIPIKGNPQGIAVGDGNVWAAAGPALFRIDPARDSIAATTLAPGRAVSVAVGFGSVWVVQRNGRGVARLDPTGAKPPVEIATGNRPSDVTIGYKHVWVANEGDGTVSQIDPARNKDVKDIRVGSTPRSISAGGGAIWVANIDAGSVSRIEADSGTIRTSPVELGQRPNDLDYGEGALWVCDVFDGTVTRVDPASMKAGDPIGVGPRPRGIKVGLGGVWVSNGGDGTVTRIDPTTSQMVGAPIDVGDEPADIAIGSGSVWTADSGAGQAKGSVTRIDPGRG